MVTSIVERRVPDRAVQIMKGLPVDRGVLLQQLHEYLVQDVFGCGTVLQQGQGICQQNRAVPLVQRSDVFMIELCGAHIWSWSAVASTLRHRRSRYLSIEATGRWTR